MLYLTSLLGVFHGRKRIPFECSERYDGGDDCVQPMTAT